jgi:hypothetical protein
MSDQPPVTEEPPVTEPEPVVEEPVDEGAVCEVCGRRGRAEGHH